MEAIGSVPSRTNSEAPMRGAARVSRPAMVKPDFRWSAACRGDGDGTKERAPYLERSLGLRSGQSTRAVAIEDERTR